MVFKEMAGPSEATPELASSSSSTITNSSSTGDLDNAGLSIHTVLTPDNVHAGVIVRVQPPVEPGPSHSRSHIPSDIVLVIDVSGSMQVPAPAKMNDEFGRLSKENFGLSILDMVKHAARTILKSLDERDRLGIVTFSAEARVLQKLLPMTPDNKKLANDNIEKMEPEYSTNLWHGIQKGVGLFEGEENTGRVPAVMILTDGQPNHMCPAQGYISKMRSIWEKLPAAIHTFGFGYEIRSGLLKSIAEYGGGNYAFIPDAGMIGTVFVHAVAHLQTTYATKATMQITTSKNMRLKTTLGNTIFQQEQESVDGWHLTINLGNLQYGQSRDIYLKNVDDYRLTTELPVVFGLPISAKVTFSRMKGTEYCWAAQEGLGEGADLPNYLVAYHQSRSMICDFLSSFFPLRSDREYETSQQVNPERYKYAFQQLLDKIPARLYTDEYNKSLMEDLVGNLPSGQVQLALSKKEYFSQWGCHYLLSLWNAHAKQMCNSFKDPGPLMYNRNPFFIRFRDFLDTSFDTIPPPKPSCPQVATTTRVMMRSLNSSIGPCFTGSSKVLLACGRKIPIRQLQQGSYVWTPMGSRRVEALLKTIVQEAVMCKIGDLVVTPWHPIKVADEWGFPQDLTLNSEHPQVVVYSGHIYSVLLQPGQDPEAHAIEVGGTLAVTLGHGIVRGDDVRAHQFLGDYERVLSAIAKFRPGKDGVALSSGVERCNGDGLVCGFKEYLPSQHTGMEKMEERVVTNPWDYATHTLSLSGGVK
ncbi:hint-domain-containing protein [Hypoxylon trugodes]|uniref:hint-domain-containing protein n=1 Tax=Hypoxylon trugodes TaxID=326681 RepID=UPI00219A832E|nr:hint-domain-containing protein [Hypoxylon trugodes]KAI1388121.1 hint-domain-containing protein [Hypoxylon trugodes]